MEKEFLKIKEKTPTQEGEDLVMDKIIEKYGFKKIQEEGIEKIVESFVRPTLTIEKRIEIFENLPGGKISRLIKELVEEKIIFEDFISKLQSQLNLSKIKAEELAIDLEEIISRAKIFFSKSKEEFSLYSSPIKQSKSTTKTTLKTEAPLKANKISTSQKQDIYRESIK